MKSLAFKQLVIQMGKLKNKKIIFKIIKVFANLMPFLNLSLVLFITVGKLLLI